MSSFLERNRFLVAFAALSSLMGTSIGLAKMATSLYSLELGASDTMLGLISGAQMVGIMFMGLPVGFMIDRLGPTPLFLTGSVLAGLVYAAVPLVPTAEFLLLCTIVISFFMPLRFISLNTIFMKQLEIVGENKAGWYRGSHMMGMFFLGPMIAPALIQRFNFNGVFYLIAAIFALTIVISPIVLKSYGGKQAAGHATTAPRLSQQLSLLWAHPGIRQLSIIEFCCHGMNMFYSFFIVVIAINNLHLSAVDATGLVAIEGMAYVFALFFMGGLSSLWSQQKTYISCFVLISIALAVLGNTTTLPLLWSGALLLGLSSGTLEVVNLTRFARIGIEIGRGKVAAINALTGPGGSLCASLIGGPLGSYLGLQAVFTLFIPVWLLLILMLLRSDPVQQAKVTPVKHSTFKLRQHHKIRLTRALVVLAPLSLLVAFPEASQSLVTPVIAEMSHFNTSLIYSTLSEWWHRVI